MVSTNPDDKSGEEGEEADKKKAEEEDAKKEAAAKAAEEDKPPPKPPEMVIDYNKRHVNYDRSLRQLVSSSERSKVATHYDVVSEVPTSSIGGRRSARQMEEYQRNLNGVLDGFRRLGVQDARISVRSATSQSVSSQKISIYKN
jgi:hypothetical protein